MDDILVRPLEVVVPGDCTAGDKLPANLLLLHQSSRRIKEHDPY